MPIQKVLNKGQVPVKIYTEDIAPEAIQQLLNIASLPFIKEHVAVMPDVHLGKGATVGSVIPTVGALIPAAVGVDIGCFIGETKVPLLNGSEASLKSLAEQGGEHWIYAIDSKHNITGAKATAKLTRKNAALIKVTLDNDEEIICTPDHQFMLRDGSWLEAKDLQVNTSLMPFYKHEDTATKIHANHKVKTTDTLQEIQDVYCLTVPEHANFALSAGVFVHNCGMNALRLSIDASQLPDNLKNIRTAIEEAVPVGFSQHKKPMMIASNLRVIGDGLDTIVGKHPGLRKMMKNFSNTWTQQLGTLGGGNHFIEICLDEDNQVWIMLHSGSRGIGNNIGQYFIQLAKKDMGSHLHQLPDKDLAYLTEGTEHFNDYVEAVHWAQDYAFENRKLMMKLIVEVLKKHIPNFTITKEAINCHHNYVAIEEHFGQKMFITRKGAIRAGEEDLGIIPGSMGAKSYIVKGKGNTNSFCSCSHGAGRKYSRSEAKRRFDSHDVALQTEGVECRKDPKVVDEIPAAYKDIDVVMENQTDLVEVVHTLKQVVCVKG